MNRRSFFRFMAAAPVGIFANNDPVSERVELMQWKSLKDNIAWTEWMPPSAINKAARDVVVRVATYMTDEQRYDAYEAMNAGTESTSAS